MKRLAALLLIGCGAPAFVPVTMTMTDDEPTPFRFLVFAHAERKLNPSCVQNCELGVAIEDGGCAEISIMNGVVTCVPDGGFFMPFESVRAPDAGAMSSHERRIAPGSIVKLNVYSDKPSCEATFEVPSGPMMVEISRNVDGVCSFSQR